MPKLKMKKMKTKKMRKIKMSDMHFGRSREVPVR